MLRVAMRLTKVAPDKAKTWVAKAVSNGLFVSNDDNAIVRHTNGSPSDDSAEPYGKSIFQSGYSGVLYQRNIYKHHFRTILVFL